MSAPLTVDDQGDAYRKEYGVYVATSTIYVGSARAFNAGDPVPVSHVESGVVSSEQVAKRDTKAGRAVTEQSTSTDNTPKG